MDVLSKAVSANAGSMTRQAAAVAAAGGLVVTLGVTGSTAHSKIKAAPKGDTTHATLDIQRAANTEIVAHPVKKAPATGSLVKVVAKPKAEPQQPLAQPTVTAPVQKTLPKLEQSNTTTNTTAATNNTTATTTKTSDSDSKSQSSSSSSSSDDSVSTKTVSSSVDNSSIVSTAKSYIGSPYVHGGTTPSGWDCIGFVRYVFAQHGVSIGGSTTSVLSAGHEVPYSEVQAGDILYWPGHVAISLGGSTNVGAWNPGMGTKIGPNSWVGGTPTVIRVG
jgi:cell wall-associated NlpC family hydrolase